MLQHRSDCYRALILLLLALLLPLGGVASAQQATPEPLGEYAQKYAECAPWDEGAAIAKARQIESLTFDNCPAGTTEVYVARQGNDVNNCGYTAETACRCPNAALRAADACPEPLNVAIVEYVRTESEGTPMTGEVPVGKPLPNGPEKEPSLWPIVLAVVVIAAAIGVGLGYGGSAAYHAWRRRSGG
jgi:hypothetical protein